MRAPIVGRVSPDTMTALALVAGAITWLLLVWLLLLHCASAAAAAPVSPTEAWHRTYDGPARGADAFHGVVVTGDGGPVAAGYATATRGHGSDVLLARYTSSGARKWLRLWNGPASGDDRANAIVRDSGGSFYVVGVTAGRDGDLLVMRYSATGLLRWYRRYDSGLSRRDEGLFVTVDGARNVYVVGTSRTKTGISWKVLKYDAAGNRLWVSSFASGFGDALPNDLAGDGTGRLFVSGTYDTQTEVRGVTRAYSPRGRLLWHRTYDLGTITRPTGVSWASHGVYVSVSVYERDEIPVAARIVKHDPTSGAELWAKDWTTVPAAAPYEFRDVVALPSFGAAAVGDYALSPGMGACLFFSDSAGTATTGETWPDPALESSGLFAVADTAANAWSVGFHGDHLTVVRFTPGVGSTTVFEYAGQTLTQGQAAAAQGTAALYVAGWAQNPGGSLQALLLRVRP